MGPLKLILIATAILSLLSLCVIYFEQPHVTSGKVRVFNGNSVERLSVPRSIVPNPPQNSEFAYTTLISGINRSFKYRGFLYNTLIMRKALVDAGSKADFIAMIGYSDNSTEIFDSDINLLKENGIIVYVLPRLLEESSVLSFAEMALLKITPWSFTSYRRVQFFDGDVMPTRNMDCFFSLDVNTFTVGAVSPLNSGWFLAIPNQSDYLYMRSKANWRLRCDWDIVNGWAEPISLVDLSFRGGKSCTLWDFNGADMDQGLFTHRFILHEGRVSLIDTELKTMRFFSEGRLQAKDVSVELSTGLAVCGGVIPTSFFAHFTGRSKPWMMQDSLLASAGPNIKQWFKHLDELKLEANSSNLLSRTLGSPLGFFNSNFPKQHKKCSVSMYVNSV